MSKDKKCSFCDETPAEGSLITNDDDSVSICSDCIATCVSLFASEAQEESQDEIEELEPAPIPEPYEIKEFLDQYVIGQDNAKKVLSVAVHNHFKRLTTLNDGDDVEVGKTGIIMTGPSGSGKTLLAQSIAKMVDVPIAIVDATALTEAGYVGDDVESIITRLLNAADGDIEKCQRGIIFIDEIDKKRKNARNGQKDVSGEGVQQALLKMIEGMVVDVPTKGNRKTPGASTVKIDTSNILFIVSGAFVGLTDIKNKASTGFIKSEVKKTKEISTDDLIEYGIIPEFVGRLPVVVSLDTLEVSDLIKILTEPKNAIVKQYQKLFKMSGVDLQFSHEALTEIANQAIKAKTGARGLRGIIENSLLDIQYDLKKFVDDGAQRVIINDANILTSVLPKIEYAKRTKRGKKVSES